MTWTNLSSAAVAEVPHDSVNVQVKHLRQLGAELVDTRRLLVVRPGVVEHLPHVLTKLGGGEMF